MRFHPRLRIAATLVATVAATNCALADPLQTLLDKGNGAACYERVYDEAHLAKNPGQTTHAMLVSLRAEGGFADAVLRIRITRAKAVLYMMGECGYAEKANLDIMGEKLIPAFKGPGGLDCHVYTSADGSSAEEGGDFPIDLKDGQSLIVYFPEDLTAWRSIDRSDPANFESFGTDDQIFRVDRTSTSVCREMVRDLPNLL